MMFLLVGLLMMLSQPLLAGAELPMRNFTIAAQGRAATIVCSTNEWPGVRRTVGDLRDDVHRVSGVMPEVKLCKNIKDIPLGAIIAGTLGRNPWVERLARRHGLSVDSIRGKWESYIVAVTTDGVLIVGSDRRATIYGIYDISERIGVSPWYWWADVPVRHQDTVTLAVGMHLQSSPAVKFRGIFINDEWPSFGTWSEKHFGGMNSKMYCHLFELLLRLHANYLWPAMWGTNFNEDDPLNPKLADEYGIVMGTSHHEPMMRSHNEYTSRREKVGPWDYATNKKRIDHFFLDGMVRNKHYDNLVTIGMRGDGDVAMGKGDDTENMQTLQDVIHGQRSIIKKIYGREDAVPQLWAIFTEVQRYYDRGFRVPDDVTLLFCDNNWGYIRRAGNSEIRSRKGGAGLYYHIDMNGGPWNDRWINTSPIPKLREQLELAYRSGLDRIWIINVGDLKPKELPIDFIMHYAWNPSAVQAGDEGRWLRNFSSNIFGEELADSVADILTRYPKYNLWRKIETEIPGLYDVERGEAKQLYQLWQELKEKTIRLEKRVPAEMKDAFYQLVYYPAVASAGAHQIYVDAGYYGYLAARGDSTALRYKADAERLFMKDQELAGHYNKGMKEGKWDGMMLDKKLGYTHWYMPDADSLPAMFREPIAERQQTERKAVEMWNALPEVAILATAYTRNVPSITHFWRSLPDLGRYDGCMGSSDVMAPSDTTASAPHLEYTITQPQDTALVIALGILPTQDIYPQRGLRIGVSIDGGQMHILDARRGLVDTFGEYTTDHIMLNPILRPLPSISHLSLSGWDQECHQQKQMRNEVFDDLRWLDITFPTVAKGNHTLQVYLIDPEIALEQIVVNPDNHNYSYFRWVK